MNDATCCTRGFRWSDTPSGRTEKLADNEAYVSGTNPDIAILVIADLFGWTFPNNRLLADHYAQEIGATVYVPDFFGGEVIPSELVLKEDWAQIDLPSWLKKNSRDKREPEIFRCAAKLRQQYKKVAAIGFCYGGWAVCRLGASQHQPALVDCVVAGHPSMLTKDDMDNIAVPIQFLAPEFDPMFTDELKSYAFQTIPKLGVPFDYQHFPGVSHGCFVRGDQEKKGDREAMERGKNSAVAWMAQFLLEKS